MKHGAGHHFNSFFILLSKVRFFRHQNVSEYLQVYGKEYLSSLKKRTQINAETGWEVLGWSGSRANCLREAWGGGQIFIAHDQFCREILFNKVPSLCPLAQYSTAIPESFSSRSYRSWSPLFGNTISLKICHLEWFPIGF